jgi:DNA polymerase V
VSQPLYALVDCNAFFVSCERVFQPVLRRRAVVVLSSNDGCVIARSPEAKELNIPMGEPAFRLKDVISSGKLLARSSNFALYSDMSSRVMAALAIEGHPQEVYSIDECFLDVANESEPLAWANATRARILRETGIPTSIGVAPTKTLAKLTNEQGKKAGGGVCVLPPEGPERAAFLAARPVQSVWGIGGHTAPKLESAGIRTAGDLADADPTQLRALFGLGVLRTARELAGEVSLPIGEEPQAPQSITVSRSFGSATSDLAVIRAAVAAFVENACAKARHQGVDAAALTIWLSPRGFQSADAALTVSLQMPTALTAEVQGAASAIIQRLYRPKLEYKKAGVTLIGLQPVGARQESFLDHLDRPRAERRQAAIDAINAGEGRRMVRSGATLLSSAWQPTAQRMSPRYTTQWDELLEAH